MTVSVNDILTKRVRVLLRDIDAGGIQWKDEELISWFNEACGEIVRVRPEAGSATDEVELVSGAKQSIPAGASRLLEAICNSIGGAEGRAVRRVKRSTLDNEDPEWMGSTASSTVFRYVPSLTDPRTFYVYPPSSGGVGTGLSIVYSAAPVKVTALEDSLPIPDMYESLVANYILYRAFAKLTESPDAQNRSVGYLNIFKSQTADSVQSMEQDNAVTRDVNQGRT
jgi:hypothetical protein